MWSKAFVSAKLPAFTPGQSLLSGFTCLVSRSEKSPGIKMLGVWLEDVPWHKYSRDGMPEQRF